MEKIELAKEKKILSSIEDVFSVSETANFLFENNLGIVIVLDYIKAKDWPWKGQSLANEPVEKIPLIWAVFSAIDNKDIKMVYDIHPTKCFPQRYNRCNPNSKNIPISTGRYGILGGCRRAVEISNRRYEVFEKTPVYCSIFGIPDDCYNPKFEKRLIKVLLDYKKLELWCFEKTDYIREKLEPLVSFCYMKGEFLPSTHFIYIDTSENFLKGVFRTKELETLNSEFWYSSGKELIEEMNLDNTDICFRYEQKASYYIKKRLIFEFIRQVLLLMNKEPLSSFCSRGPPILSLDEKKENVQTALKDITNTIEIETISYIKTVMKQIEKNIDLDSFKRSRFLVMDVEYIHVLYPTGVERTFNFPCIFSSIVWRGVREGFMVDINPLILPCHFCDISCTDFKKNRLKFNCLSFGYEFIDKQISMIEEMLLKYEGFKIYSYGLSDISQLEQGTNFFTDSFEIRRYKRRNRKRTKRIVDVSYDLSVSEKRLSDIENEILKQWLVGWSRKKNKVNVNSRFITRYDSPHWRNKYFEAINSCVWDTLSAFLYLIYEKYRKSKNNVKFQESPNIMDFISARGNSD